MYKIGEFSVLSKTTIKTLRYYEKEKLLIPVFIDPNTNYRYYEAEQLIDLSKIISLRQVGLSISDIKKILKGDDLSTILEKRKKEITLSLNLYNNELSKIDYLLEGNIMKYEVITKTLPDYTIYYKEGTIASLKDIVNFIISSGEECRKLNPNIKCIEPDYCYVAYLDKEFKDTNLLVRYAQAVTKAGVGNESIKFETLKPVEAVCTYHKGPYTKLSDAYSFIMKYIEDNNYEILEPPRERYIDGIWNKDNEEDWLTELQVPVRKK